MAIILTPVISLLFASLLLQCADQNTEEDIAQFGNLGNLGSYGELLEPANLGNLGSITDAGYLGSQNGPSARPNPQHLEWAQEALDAWEIGLEQDLTALYRREAQKNWITVADESCYVVGVEPTRQGRANCGLAAPNVIGICHFSLSPSSGELVQTTVIVEESFLMSSISDEEKISVFIHEIGHCLGLRHPDEPPMAPCGNLQTNCVMHSTTRGANRPHRDELEAISSAYGGMGAREPAQSHENRYTRVGGPTSQTAPLRHFTFPRFYISEGIGSLQDLLLEAEEQAEERSEESLVRHIYILYNDYSELLHTVWADGNEEFHLIEGK